MTTSTTGEAPKGSKGLVVFLSAYLLIVAGTACYTLIAIFPTPGVTNVAPGVAPPVSYADVVWFGVTIVHVRGPDQCLVLLALLAGFLGSFMHAAQSLGAFVGNREFAPSWTLWYLLRPPVGGILGLLFYTIMRAGLIPAANTASAQAVSPYGVVAFGALAGWFSKRATDKLAEVFETLFRTAKDLEYRDKLSGAQKPKIVQVDPGKLAAAAHAGKDVHLTLTCEKIASGAWVNAGDTVLPTTWLNETHLTCSIPGTFPLSAGMKLKLTVTNPPPASAVGKKGEVSEPFEIAVE